MTDRIPLSRATTASTNSSSDDLLSLVEEPIRYIPPLECTKPSYNINEDRINMNNYHQVDIHQVKNIYDYIKNLDLFLAETSVTDSKILHCGNIERINHILYFITNYLDTNGNRRRIELNDQHILYINLFNYSMIMDMRRRSSTPAAGGKKKNKKSNKNKKTKKNKNNKKRTCKRIKVRINKDGSPNEEDMEHNRRCEQKYMYVDNPWMKPLLKKKKLTRYQKYLKKMLTNRIQTLKRKDKSTLQKYKTRNSPPLPANDYCNQKKKGNDGNMYISKPNKNNICSWKMV